MSSSAANEVSAWKDLTNFIPHFAFGQVSLYVNYFDCQIFFALQSSAENFCKVASHCHGPSKVLEHPLQNLQDKLIESPAWLLLVFALEFWENDLIYLNIKMPSHYKDRPKQLWMCSTILRVLNFMNEVPKWRAQYLAPRSVAWQQETPSPASSLDLRNLSG